MDFSWGGKEGKLLGLLLWTPAKSERRKEARRREEKEQPHQKNYAWSHRGDGSGGGGGGGGSHQLRRRVHTSTRVPGRVSISIADTLFTSREKADNPGQAGGAGGAPEVWGRKRNESTLLRLDSAAVKFSLLMGGCLLVRLRLKRRSVAEWRRGVWICWAFSEINGGYAQRRELERAAAKRACIAQYGPGNGGRANSRGENGL